MAFALLTPGVDCGLSRSEARQAKARRCCDGLLTRQDFRRQERNGILEVLFLSLSSSSFGQRSLPNPERLETCRPRRGWAPLVIAPGKGCTLLWSPAAAPPARFHSRLTLALASAKGLLCHKSKMNPDRHLLLQPRAPGRQGCIAWPYLQVSDSNTLTRTTQHVVYPSWILSHKDSPASSRSNPTSGTPFFTIGRTVQDISRLNLIRARASGPLSRPGTR